MRIQQVSLLGALALSIPMLSACTQNSEPSGSAGTRTISVVSTDDGCEVSPDQAPAGTLTFTVVNNGTKVTEFYLYREAGKAIAGEVENIGPNLDRNLVVKAPAGSYVTSCRPGMEGKGIRADFTVTRSDVKVDVDADQQAQVEHAEKEYGEYVRDQADQLLAKTETFTRLYESGKDDAARALYPRARTHWERIETVAESFGDLDPKMDAREADLEDGQKWTGWHRIEKDLWPQRATGYQALTMAERKTFAADLLDNTKTLHSRIQDLDFTIDQIANGSRGLLEEVATGKVTGEEEYWSRTDLWDFQANVDGAYVGFEGVRPILEQKDPALARQLEDRFENLQDLLDAQRRGQGFASYDQLSQNQVKRLADAVSALSEPLSHLTAAVLS